MKLKHRLILRVAKTVRAVNLAKYVHLNSEDERPNTPFKLIFFCGSTGLTYLNSSLVSVYKAWESLPEIYVISDGTPVDKIKKGLIKWPRRVDVVSWEECARAFKEKGNHYLYDYASKVLLGKKLVGMLYCAERFPTLYSDSDVLWFKSPLNGHLDVQQTPCIKMCKDVGFFYTKPLLELLNEEKCLEGIPFNSGITYLSGNFSVYPKWDALCKVLSELGHTDWFSEQTSFAILNNYFNPEGFFSLEEVLIKVDDEYNLKYTKTDFPDILARHYVNKKATTFWRDFLYIFFKARKKIRPHYQ